MIWQGVSEKLFTILFADDTTILIEGTQYYVLGFIRVMNDKETTVSIINSLFI